jgi:hypothetical protein
MIWFGRALYPHRGQNQFSLLRNGKVVGYVVTTSVMSPSVSIGE